MKRFPKNSGPLIALRKQRGIPPLPVLISFVGPLAYDNVTLQADIGERYDWRPVATLNVEVFASIETPFHDLLRALADIAEVVPETMVLTFSEGPRIHCGEWRQITDFRLFDWFPMAIGPMCYLEGAMIAKRIFGELGHTIPIPFDEACDLYVKSVQESMQ